MNVAKNARFDVIRPFVFLQPTHRPYAKATPAPKTRPVLNLMWPDFTASAKITNMIIYLTAAYAVSAMLTAVAAC